LKVKLLVLKLLGITGLGWLVYFLFSNVPIVSFDGIIPLLVCLFSYLSLLRITKKNRFELLLRITLSAVGVYVFVGSLVMSDLELWFRFFGCFLGTFISLPLFFKCKTIFEIAMRSF
jgi:hypothetical protein